MNFNCRLFAVIATAFALTPGSGAGIPEAGALMPPEWTAPWRNPPAECRPLQIVHGLTPAQATAAEINKLKDLGIGGIVCNVSFDRYLTHEPHWRTLIDAVRACNETGMIVWIYDEHGYPSAAAGGLVLKDNPDLESLALAYDPARAEPFVVRPSYEHTHASNNFHAARRYPNLLDERATRRFIETTHEAYANHLQPFFGTTIRAFFTDEPSLMAVNIGPLPDNVRKNVPVADPLDPNVKTLPSVPWVRDMPQLYEKRFGRDIVSLRKSLFEAGSDLDRRVRSNFWALVSDLLAENYYAQIRTWCREHRVASSGHILWEEMPLHGVPLEGNPLQMLMEMDIPGLDMLTSDPEAVIHTGWLTAVLPASAALFNGGRKVMTEVSDFSEQMAGKGHASLQNMSAAAAWQAALGVTEFTLYYNRDARPAPEYRAYCDYVGRLNAVLRNAAPARSVALYYPIHDLWAEYTPVGEKLTPESQSPRARSILNSFMALGRSMTRRQISFSLVDHRLLSDARVRDGLLWVKGRAFYALAVPAGVQLPAPVAELARRFETAGGSVVRDGDEREIDFNTIADPQGRISPRDDRIVIGRFTRDKRPILLLVNVADKAYDGTVFLRNAPAWIAADPAAGQVKPARDDGADRIRLSLPPRASMLLIGPP